MIKLFYNSLELFVMAWLMSAGLTTVQSTISGFVGSGAAGRLGGGHSPLGDKLKELQTNVKNAVHGEGENRNTLGNSKGAEFLSNIAGATKSGAGKTLGSMLGTGRKGGE